MRNEQGGNQTTFESGETLRMKSGSTLQLDAGAAANFADTSITKVARGVSAVTGTLDLNTGLTTVVAIVVSLAENPAVTGDRVSATLVGGAGHALLAAWKPTAVDDCTPIAATAPKNVAWIAVGT